METLVQWATALSPAVSGGVAIWAILVAKKTISENKEIAKKTVADTAYQTYLQLAMENPDFSKGYSAVSARDPKYDKYVWYIARMLFCFEQVIEVKDSLKDESWDKTLTKHLGFHAEHFKKTKVVEEKLYCTPVLDLIQLSQK
ncbi:restriction endonuclease [Vibrio splendidus]|uniref:restriction endonuclease n=1 Tax=Vibrio splendidus TaxID=29497 RepID=UPI000D3C36A5|nr:restriction endonuclease [Vibrio splendidus]PTO70540.1 restriction endonuclease [Vibrio splendidus]